MKNLLKKKNTQNYLLIIAVSFSIVKFFNLPYNFYSVLKWDYTSRMEQNYGFCNNEAWGFINYINKNFLLKKNEVKIINDGGFVTLEHLFEFGQNKVIKPKNIILLNFESENNQSIESKFDFTKDYAIEYRFNNCFLMKLYD